jgi:hypothetical protein
MSGVCSRNEGQNKGLKIYTEYIKGRLSVLGIYWRTILKFILKKLAARPWNSLKCLKITFSGGILTTR